MQRFIKEIVTIQKLSVNCSRLHIETKIVGIEEGVMEAIGTSEWTRYI